MLGAGMHDEAFDLQCVAVLLAPRTGRSEAFPLAQAVVGQIADWANSVSSRPRRSEPEGPSLDGMRSRTMGSYSQT